MATLALFVALGGVGYAAGKLARDSVGPKQIRADAVRASEQAPDSVDSSNILDASVAPGDLEPSQIKSPTLEDCATGVPWASAVPFNLDPHYWKDATGVVHLEGAVTCSGTVTPGPIFEVEGVAYRPAQNVTRYAMLANGLSIAQVAVVDAGTGATIVYDGGTAANSDNYVSLDGITYRAAG